MNLNQLTKNPNLITALTYVSESDIKLAVPSYDSSWEELKPSMLKRVLHEFGLDTEKPYERQDGLMHRNMQNQVVICSRFVGQSRLDEEWINSGFASKEAKDKASGSKILEAIYRQKKLTEDTQAELEIRDEYKVVDETQWVD